MRNMLRESKGEMEKRQRESEQRAESGGRWLVEGVRNEEVAKAQSLDPRSPSTPLLSHGPARGEESNVRARSPSPLGCRALNGWRSAAPPHLAPHPQVRGSPSPRSRRAEGPLHLSAPIPALRIAPLRSPPLLWRSQSSSRPRGTGLCGHQRHCRSHFSLRAWPTESLGAGSIYSGY